MVNKVLDYCEQYHMIASGDVVVTGVSGGADSVCLLFMLLAIREKVPFHLAVAHVDCGRKLPWRQPTCMNYVKTGGSHSI